MSDIIAPDWPAPSNIRAFTSTRNGPGLSEAPFQRFNLGARCGDDVHAVSHNRQALQSHYRLPSQPIWLHQVHGIDVIRLGEGSVHGRGAACCAQADEEPIADASVTSIGNKVLAVLTADCLPVLFCNDAGTEIAAVHAGWRGLAARVLEQTIAAMQSSPDTLMAWLGPAAGAARYEIGEEVRQAFLSADVNAASAFTPTRPGHYLIDMPAIARARLQSMGVGKVFGGDLCTLSDLRFYSHRREQCTGRMASVIWIA